MNIEEKSRFIHEWLEDLFVGEEVPAYEINSHTVDILYAMAQRSRKKESISRVLIEAIEQKSHEYSSEMERLKSEAQYMGVASTGKLSAAARTQLENVASTAAALGLSDCTDTSLCLALSELCCQRAHNEVERQEMVREETRLQENLRQVIVKQANQKKALEEVNRDLKAGHSATAKKLSKVDFLKQKTAHYLKLAASVKTELEQMGYKSEYSHSALKELSKEVQELQLELDPLKSRLSSYQDLPPDIDLIKIKLHEARRHLETLEEEFSRNIDLVHTQK